MVQHMTHPKVSTLHKRFDININEQITKEHANEMMKDGSSLDRLIVRHRFYNEARFTCDKQSNFDRGCCFLMW